MSYLTQYSLENNGSAEILPASSNRRITARNNAQWSAHLTN
jgi:hypothetical protein